MADDNVTPIGKTRRPAKKASAKKVPPKGIVVSVEAGAEEHRLRLLGHTWTEIANKLGHASPMTAQAVRGRYLQRASLALSREKKLEALQLEVERLDTLQVSYWTAATETRTSINDEGVEERFGPDPKAAEIILKIIAQRSKLLGLEEPDQGAQGPRTIVVTGDSEQYVATLKKLIAGDVEDAEIVEDD